MIMDSPPPQVRTRAYAKINIGLSVTAKRPDGFHDICTVFHRIDLFDDLTLSAADAITVHATDPGVPSGEGNIAHAAARLLARELGAGTGVRIDITKRIPSGAGLGGGSADAAAVLSVLPGFWGKPLAAEDLRRLALTLGSDVPFFLGSESALGTGRGEILGYFPLDVPYAILLGAPPVSVPTAWAYARIVPRGEGPGDLRALVLEGMSDPARLRGEVVNDFEGPVFAAHPGIAALKESMTAHGALYASMSGSGSSVYGFFPDAGAAGEAARALRTQDVRTFITPPHFRL